MKRCVIPATNLLFFIFLWNIIHNHIFISGNKQKTTISWHFESQPSYFIIKLFKQFLFGAPLSRYISSKNGSSHNRVKVNFDWQPEK